MSEGEGEGETASEQASRTEGEHAYLLLSRSDSTMVLQTGQEIAELDSSGFATQTPTVCAGNLGGGNYIVQVNTTSAVTQDTLNEGTSMNSGYPKVFEVRVPIIECDLHYLDCR